RMTYFLPILAYCLAADMELAVVTAWFSTPSTLVIQMFCVIVGSLLLIAFAYWRVWRVLIQPGVTEKVGQDALLDLLRESADSNEALTRANRRLADVVTLSWSSPESNTTDVRRIVRSSRRRVLTDVNLPQIRDVIMELDARSNYAATASALPSLAPGDASRVLAENRPELHMLAELGSTVDKDKYVFYVTNADRFRGVWADLEHRLSSALEWD
ncbi:MAG: hypothetical protein ACM3ZE_07645, partial [Myxococcales bacterium]